jgi:hypothetical protein
MTIEAAFLEMMPSSVTIYGQSSKSAYGVQAWSASGTSVRCRIQQTGVMSHDQNGRQVIEDGRIIFYGVPTIDLSSKISLPDGTTPVLLSVVVHNDEDGTNHTTVTYGRA